MSNQHLRSIPILLATGKDKNARVTFLSFSLLRTHHDRQVFDNKNLPSLKRYLLLLLWSKTKRWQKHLSLVCSCREYTYNFKPVADKIKADFNLKNRLMPVLALHLPPYLPTYLTEQNDCLMKIPLARSLSKITAARRCSMQRQEKWFGQQQQQQKTVLRSLL